MNYQGTCSLWGWGKTLSGRQLRLEKNVRRIILPRLQESNRVVSRKERVLSTPCLKLWRELGDPNENLKQDSTHAQQEGNELTHYLENYPMMGDTKSTLHQSSTRLRSLKVGSLSDATICQAGPLWHRLEDMPTWDTAIFSVQALRRAKP